MTSAPTAPDTTLQVVLLEDQQMVADGITALLRQALDARILRVFPSVASALADETTLRKADLALVDYYLGEQADLGEFQELRRRFPTLRCIWLTGAVADASLLGIQRLRLEAFVHKDDPSDHLLQAIHEVLAGRTYQSPTAKRLLATLQQTEVSVPRMLSEREQEILGLIGSGLDNQEIAAAVGLSASTAQTHRRNIMGKLGLHTSAALQAYAQRSGFSKRVGHRNRTS